jgi:hypothetical protein
LKIIYKVQKFKSSKVRKFVRTNIMTYKLPESFQDKSGDIVCMCARCGGISNTSGMTKLSCGHHIHYRCVSFRFMPFQRIKYTNDTINRTEYHLENEVYHTSGMYCNPCYMKREEEEEEERIEKIELENDLKMCNEVIGNLVKSNKKVTFIDDVQETTKVSKKVEFEMRMAEVSKKVAKRKEELRQQSKIDAIKQAIRDRIAQPGGENITNVKCSYNNMAIKFDK